MSLDLSVLSTEYVRVQVAATKSGVTYDPTADTVEFAFTASGVNPVSGDWKTGGWETLPGPVYIARVLVGPAGVTALALGRYDVWVKVHDSPEVPVKASGYIAVT